MYRFVYIIVIIIYKKQYYYCFVNNKLLIQFVLCAIIQINISSSTIEQEKSVCSESLFTCLMFYVRKRKIINYDRKSGMELKI